MTSKTQMKSIATKWLKQINGGTYKGYSPYFPLPPSSLQPARTLFNPPIMPPQEPLNIQP